MYLLFGLLVLAGFGAAEFRGWTLLRASETRVGPRSVRQNPGSYRSIYVGGSRYRGGK
jgi:hypothetical protein